MKKAIILLLLILMLLPSIIGTKAEANSIWRDLKFTSANNTLTVKISTFLGEDLYDPYGSNAFRYLLIITAYKDVNGTWVYGNRTVLNVSNSGAGYSGSWSFQNIRPTASAIAIRGKFIASVSKSFTAFSSLSNCGPYSGWYAYKYRVVGTAESGRIVINVYGFPSGKVECSYYQTDTLLSVFQVQNPDKMEGDFELDFNSGKLSYTVTGGLANTWAVVEGCGDNFLSKTGAIAVTIYSNFTAAASDAVRAIDAALRSDSKGLVYVKEFSIKSLNLYEIAKARNKTVDKLVPSDFYFYLPSFQSVSILHIPSGYFNAAGIYAGSGLIFVHSLDTYVLLHEIAHGAGFCDPDPYGDWKKYWNSFTGASLSMFSNSTWYSKTASGVKYWVTLETVPICPMTKSLSLVFSVKSEPSGKEFDYTLSAQLGSISPASGSGTTNTKISAVYTAPSRNEAVVADYITFKLKTADGEEFAYPFFISVPKLSIFNTTLQQQYNPNQSIFAWNPYLQWLAQYALNQSASISNLTDPNAIKYAQKAEFNFQKAQEDAMKAQMSNNSCVIALLQQAAYARIQAGNAWLSLAKAYQTSWYTGIGNWYIAMPWSENVNEQATIQLAQQWEQKASILEMQAAIGCPSGFLSSGSGINPLLGILGLLSGSGGGLGGIANLCLILGVVLCGLGVLGMLTGTKELKKMFTWGAILIAIYVVLLWMGGI